MRTLWASARLLVFLDRERLANILKRIVDEQGVFTEFFGFRTIAVSHSACNLTCWKQREHGLLLSVIFPRRLVTTSEVHGMGMDLSKHCFTRILEYLP